MSDRNRAGILARRLILRVADPHEATAVAGAQALSAVTTTEALLAPIALWDVGLWDTDLWNDDGVALVTPDVTTARWNTGWWDKHYWSA